MQHIKQKPLLALILQSAPSSRDANAAGPFPCGDGFVARLAPLRYPVGTALCASRAASLPSGDGFMRVSRRFATQGDGFIISLFLTKPARFQYPHINK